MTGEASAVHTPSVLNERGVDYDAYCMTECGMLVCNVSCTKAAAHAAGRSASLEAHLARADEMRQALAHSHTSKTTGELAFRSHSVVSLWRSCVTSALITHLANP